MKYNSMQYLYDYLKGNIFSQTSNISYSCELYNPLKTYKKPININKYLLKELNKIDKRLKVIEEILKN